MFIETGPSLIEGRDLVSRATLLEQIKTGDFFTPVRNQYDIIRDLRRVNVQIAPQQLHMCNTLTSSILEIAIKIEKIQLN